MQKKYYVYVHKHASCGGVFYVGKGSGKRAYVKHGRPAVWQLQSALGYTVEIIATFENEICAFSIERALISFLSQNTDLANDAMGGPGGGMIGKTHGPESRQKMSQASRGKKKKNETRKRMSIAVTKCWKEEKYRNVRVQSLRDKKEYNFSHPVYGDEVNTQFGISQKHGFSRGAANSLISGRYKSYKGWKIK